MASCVNRPSGGFLVEFVPGGKSRKRNTFPKAVIADEKVIRQQWARSRRSLMSKAAAQRDLRSKGGLPMHCRPSWPAVPRSAQADLPSSTNSSWMAASTTGEQVGSTGSTKCPAPREPRCFGRGPFLQLQRRQAQTHVQCNCTWISTSERTLSSQPARRLVAKGGIEPPTQGFSVLCSTN